MKKMRYSSEMIHSLEPENGGFRLKKKKNFYLFKKITTIQVNFNVHYLSFNPKSYVVHATLLGICKRYIPQLVDIDTLPSKMSTIIGISLLLIYSYASLHGRVGR